VWNHLEWPPVEWIAGPADVVHAQTPLLIPAARAAQVITIHDLDFLMHPERVEAEMQRDFPRLAAHHARRADHIIVSSRYVAGEVANRLNVSSGKISVCSPGASAWAAEIAQSRASGQRGSLILFVGTLEPRKNIGGLLDAYALLRSRRAKVPPLILAGRARASVKHHLDRISLAPLSGHVQDVGYVSEDRKQQLYRDACMLVLPSFEEGFGLPVLDAMASGVPVVVSNRGSLPEVAGAAASPVDPDDANAIARAMEQLLDSDVAAAAAKRGLAQARTYSWDECARAALEAYRAAIAARATR
jgi:glycosyltransferase involved in cell wall biosynthesis